VAQRVAQGQTPGPVDYHSTTTLVRHFFPWTLRAVLRSYEIALTNVRTTLNEISVRRQFRVARAVQDAERVLLAMRADLDAISHDLETALPRLRE
jgi:hypothetical protein